MRVLITLSNSSSLANRRSSAFKRISIFILVVLVSACASYYKQNLDFNAEFQRGDLKQALEILKSHESQATGKSRFIYFANNGLLLSVLGKYSESNEYFEKAFLFGEDYHINYINETLSYLSNPNVTMYRGEDHEHLMVLYFKAINFLKMGKNEEALVECRRLNIRLNQLSDKYSSPDKYQRDAFVHNLMGIIYQSDKDYNNAFIAYRNALDVYDTDYARLFGLSAPDQLKKDLLDAAWRTGFADEFVKYGQLFGMKDYRPAAEQDAELLFFWHNGLSPVKQEWSINFVITPGINNMMVFDNADLGLNFSFHVDDDKDRADLTKLQIFRVAFPRYIERLEYFNSASIKKDTVLFPLQLCEDISKVAFHSLKERMLLEFGKGLLRAALKKTTEQGLRKEDDRLGAVLGIINAATEKADTRNWQTLPHSIFYTRIPLSVGSNTIKFTLKGEQGVTEHDFTYEAKKGQTLFHTFSSLETTAQPYRYN